MFTKCQTGSVLCCSCSGKACEQALNQPVGLLIDTVSLYSYVDKFNTFMLCKENPTASGLWRAQPLPWFCLCFTNSRGQEMFWSRANDNQYIRFRILKFGATDFQVKLPNKLFVGLRTFLSAIERWWKNGCCWHVSSKSYPKAITDLKLIRTWILAAWSTVLNPSRETKH